MNNQTNTPDPQIDNPLQLMTAEEVARLLKLDPSHVRRMAREGKIQSVKFGKSLRIRKMDLEKFIADHLSI